MSDNSNKGGRPPRKPGGASSRGGAPRKFGDKPRSDRPFGDRPRGPKPAGDKTFRDKPRAEKPFGEKSAGPRKPRAEGEGFAKRAPRDGFQKKPREGFEKRSGEGFERKSRDGFAKRPMRRDAAPAPTHEGDRIAKVMARAGLCSRRDAELWIEAGRVAVNGKILESPAYNVMPDDKITVDGHALAHRERTRLFLFHKPRGLVTTDRDPEGRQTVFDYLRETWPQGPRVVSVGRLDINTEGLLLLTNDGGLARVLELPATGWLRRYRVRANGETDQARLDALLHGVSIDGVDYAGIEAKLDRVQGANVWLTMGLREGKNREIKRVLEHLGLAVNRLIRMSFGPFQLGDLPEGAVEEVRTRVLKDQLGPQLAEQAGADFDGPLHEPESFDQIAPRRPGRRDDFDAEPAPRDRLQRPQGPRRHVSTLRADRDEEMASGARKRVERAETADRKGRAVAVERIVPARPKLEAPANRNARRFKAEREAADGDKPARRPRLTRDGEATRAPRRTRDGEQPMRREGRSDAPRGPRKFEGGERPARRFEGESRGPRKAEGGERPARRFEGEGRGPRKFEGGERPARRFEGEGRGPRKFEGGDRMQRRADGEGRSARPPRAGAPVKGPRGPRPGGPGGGKPGGRPPRKPTR